jgi:acyl carrier protein
MTYEEWEKACSPKVTGTWNLHVALQHSTLDFFVCFSSASGVCGNVGQANYAAANTFLDVFVQHRRAQGLPASVLDLGVVEDIGCISGDKKTLDKIRTTSPIFLNEGDVVKALEVAICGSKVNPSAADSDRLTSSALAAGLGFSTPLHSRRGVNAQWGLDARFNMYENYESPADVNKPSEDEDLRDFLTQIENDPTILDDVETEKRIMRELGNMMMTHTSSGKEMDDAETSTIVIDSLMSIEIRNWFRRKLNMEITLTEISKAGTVGGLAKLTIETLRHKYADTGEVAVRE